MARPKKPQPNRSDGRYEIKITVGKNADGKLVRKSFYSDKSKEDAKRQAEEWQINKRVYEITGVAEEPDTSIWFVDWANKWLEVYKKPYVSENTYLLTYKTNVDKHIIPFFKKYRLNDIKNSDVQALFATKTKLSESTLDKIKLCLVGIFETAIENDLIYKNPAKKVIIVSNKEKSEKLVYNDTQIAAAKQFFISIMPEVCLLLETGLRRGEMLGLKWSDIDLKEKSLSVNRSIADKKGGGTIVRPPKWKSYRKIPLSNYACDLLSNIPNKGDYVFPLSANQPQSPNTWSQKLERCMERFAAEADAPALTAHELRHTYGTKLRRDGVDIYTIQKIMGHKDIKMTTEIYVHDEFDVLKKAVHG